MKTQKYIFKILMLLSAILTAFVAFSQDSHFSMSQFNQLILNPATTGQNEFNQIRCVSQFRTQWGALGSKISSTTLAADMPLKSGWGIGTTLLNNDGSKIFSTFNWVISGSYQIMSPEQKKHRLSVGLQAGIIQKSINEKDFIFNNQYSNGYFDPDLPNFEKLERITILMPEFNYGIFYKYSNPAEKMHATAGFSIFHITTPSQSFIGTEDSPLPRRWLLHGGADYLASHDFQLSTDFLYQKQSTTDEFVCSIGGKYFAGNPALSFSASLAYRYKDAVIVAFGTEYKNLQFRMAYDFTVSKLKEYFNGIGGLELGLIYLIGK